MLAARRPPDLASSGPATVTEPSRSDLWRSFLADVADAWRSARWAAAWNEIREALLFPVLRHGRVLVVVQDLAELDDLRPPAGIEIRPLQPEDWPALRSVANRRMLRRFLKAIQHGRTAFVAWRGDRPVGYTWLSTAIRPDLEMYPIPLPPGGSYGWNLYVSPEERSRGLGSALLSARLHHSRNLGFQTGWRVVDPENRAVLRTIEKTGGSQHVAGELKYVRIFGKTYSRFRSLEPPLREQGPAIRKS